MKVAYLFGSLHRGGAETLMLDVFRNADQASYEFIGIYRKGGEYQENFYASGQKMVQLTPKRFGYIRYLHQLRSLLDKENISLIHTQHWLDCIYAWLATIGLHIPIIHTFHGYMGIEVNLFRSLYYRVVMSVADKLCFVSRYQMNQFATRYTRAISQKGCVMYNGIDFSKFDGVNKNDRIRGLEAKRVKLCMVGSFNSVRNQFAVLEALTKVERGFDFYFIGARYKEEEWRYDECVKYCVTQGLKHVHFLGGRGDVPELLREMDGFVYATRNDTFGIAVVEAMAVGLPIVVNDHPVMQEVCGIANEGLRYFRTDDSADAAKNICELLIALPKSKREAIENAKIIREKFSIENHIYHLSEMYQSLCQ